MKVLIVYASRYGSTQEIADKIAAQLTTKGLTVEVCSATDADDLTDVGAIVIGSGVYAGQWLPSLKRFVTNNAESISKIPTWAFSSGPVGDPLQPDPDKAVQIDGLLAQIKPRDHRVFAGKIDPANLSVFERAVVKMLKAATGDFRDWQAIKKWADSIASELAT